jgi:hypothetical protein
VGEVEVEEEGALERRTSRSMLRTYRRRAQEQRHTSSKGDSCRGSIEIKVGKEGRSGKK